MHIAVVGDRLVNASHISITESELVAVSEDRFDRFRRIGWWDQSRLATARVLVIGAGALGNEIIKNLALLGVGQVFVADLDRIEHSNLSRSVLYREMDNGLSKAEVAVRAAQNIYPQIAAHYFIGDVIHDMGMGAFRWADVVLGGLDNREARLVINRHCYRLGRPWIDGAIEQIQGVARVFIPDGPCYECTMSEIDWQLLQKRRSCNLLTRDEMENGKTPTTPTISSIVAGVQCQELVKLLHGLPTISGRGWVFDGLNTEGYQIQYQHNDGCLSHDPIEEVLELDASVERFTARQLLDCARRRLGTEAQIELARDILEGLVCPQCGSHETIFTSLGRVTAARANCPNCSGVRREVKTFYRIRGDESFLDCTLAEIGVPPFDIVIARSGDRAIGLEFSADRPRVLGPLVDQRKGELWL